MAKNIKPNNPYRGKPYWVADAETDPFRKGRVPVPFIWGLYTGNQTFIPNEIEGCSINSNEPSNYLEFMDTEDFIIFIQDHDVICYAHNGGKFDWHFITSYIQNFEKLTIIAGRLAKFNIGNCEFRDSFNIIPAPLGAYKKEEINYAIFEKEERYKPENWLAIRDYLKSDCIYLYEMVDEFIKTYGMGLTQASTAMKVWSRLSGIKKPKTTDLYYDDLSPYYYGGRVECFETGIIEKSFTVVDINSAYPYAMKFKHPWGTHYSISEELPDDDETISRCFIKLSADSYGAFPMRGKGGLSFPNTRENDIFFISGWEYLAARDTDCLHNCKIIEVREYFETISFDEYVDYFFDLKDEATQKLKLYRENHPEYGYWWAQRLFAKLFLNSLYGKFAANPDNYEEFMTIPADMIDGAINDGWNYCKLLDENTAVVNRPLEEEQRRYYDVAVAASITGFVRAYLWRNICSTKGSALYCDTDSIAASYIGDIPCSDKLGDWELEAQCDLAAIAGKKLYAFRKLDGTFKIASKGVRLSAADIIDIAKGETIVYEPEAPTFSIKGGVRFTPRAIKMNEN